jgi:hypothetical protein
MSMPDDPPQPRQSWPRDHPVLTTVGTVIVLVIAIAAIFGGNDSSNGSSSTITQTVTHTVTHAVRRASRGTRTRTVVRHVPAVTATARSTVTRTISAAASAPTPTASVEGPGSTSHAGDDQFCSTHTCIPNFANGNGSVVQCADGDWSHSGGLSGACSDHGGEA